MGLLGLLTPVAQILFQAFSPLAQQKIAAAVDRHSEQPGVGAAVAASLSTAIEQYAQQATGKADPLEAVAVARQQPELVQAAEKVAEETTLQRLKDLAPLLDKSVEYDNNKWAAEREGKNDAAKRTIKEKAAGLWDMTRALVLNTEGQTWFILIALCGGLAYAIGLEKESLFTGLIGVAGAVFNQVLKNKQQANDYRFDGTKESSEQTKVMAGVIANQQQKGA